LVRKALRAEEPIGWSGIRQLGIPQGAKRLEERQAQAKRQSSPLSLNVLINFEKRNEL
jgi:hypothetical protein